MVLFMDASAHVGSEVSAHTSAGGLTAQQNCDGRVLHDLLRSHDLMLPSTMGPVEDKKYTLDVSQIFCTDCSDYIAILVVGLVTLSLHVTPQISTQLLPLKITRLRLSLRHRGGERGRTGS